MISCVAMKFTKQNGSIQNVFTVHLTPNFSFVETNLLVIWNITAKKISTWLNPRFSVPRRNLKNSSKSPPFCFMTEFEENGFNGCCDVYPGRLDISSPLISLRMVQCTFEKCAETPSRGAIGCCSNIPDLKRYIVQFNFTVQNVVYLIRQTEDDQSPILRT